MKKFLLAASVAVCALACTPANAECDGFYGALRGGGFKNDIKKSEHDLDSVKMMFSGALGYRYEYFRTELEYVWREANKDEDTTTGHRVEFKSYSYMWNFYYDVLPYNWWSPYLGAGIGFTKSRYLDRDKNVIHDKWEATKFTWSVGGGLSLKVTNRFNVDAGYRYYDLNKPKGYNFRIHEVYAGIRYVL